MSEARPLPYIRLDHERVARIINETLVALNIMFNDIPPRHWADQSPEQRRPLMQVVRYLAERPDTTPEAYHEDQARRLREQDWVGGDMWDSARRVNPMARPYSEMSPKHRYRQGLVFAMARHMLANPQVG